MENDEKEIIIGDKKIKIRTMEINDNSDLIEDLEDTIEISLENLEEANEQETNSNR